MRYIVDVLSNISTRITPSYGGGCLLSIDPLLGSCVGESEFLVV